MYTLLRLLFPLACLMAAGCSGLFFYPEQDLRLTPKRVGLTYRDIRFKTPDGLTLDGWFLPAANRDGKKSSCSMLFLHGNAENISTHLASVWWLPARGVSVFMFDYRGYGLSEGTPSIEGIHVDANAALETMMHMTDVDPAHAVVFGQSLGAAVAVTMVARSEYRTKLRALIIEGAFSGFRSIMQDKMASALLTWPFQWIPSLTIDNSFNPLKSIAHLAPLPVLIVQGLADRTIPPQNARDLYNAAHEPKEIWLLPGVRHIAAFQSEANRSRLVEYLRTHGCITK